MQLSGYLRADATAKLRVHAGEHVAIAGTIDGHDVSAGDLATGVSLDPGLHHVQFSATLIKSHWSLALLWNEHSLWDSGRVSVTPPGTIDAWLKPHAWVVSAALWLAMLAFCVRHLVRRVASAAWALVTLAVAAVALAFALWAPEGLMRLVPLLLIGYAVVPPPRRLQTTARATLLIGLPWLVLWLPKAAAQAGLFTWYSPGDDWWTFQRFAYRIYLQGYWLEGGERTFWFQPLYRWIAGALHLIFGDSSAGELLWDAGAALIGALFAFHVVRRVAGFRWAIAGAALVLGTFTFGPAWHLFGRGLSEFSSMGFLYAAALMTLRARGGDWRAAIAAGVMATLATFTRLNNLPMAVAVVVFAWPLRLPAGVALRPSVWLWKFSRPAAAGVLAAMAIGLWLFTARTYYYTGVPSMLYGTTAYLNSVWNGPGGRVEAIGRVLSSLAMLITMNDPPRFDIRAVPVIVGVMAAVAGLAGGFVARGVAYPGRFSTHLIPVTIALALCAAALIARRPGEPAP
jgi:hypothetical protein